MFRRLAPGLAAVAVALFLGAWALWPAPLHPGWWVVGNWVHPDCLGNHWLLAWVAERLARGEGILHNDRYYWPVGDAPVLAGNGGEGALYLPFHLALGWPAGVVAWAVLVVALDALAGWALARAAGASAWAALAAAAVTGASPYVVSEMSSGRFTQADPAWLLFFLAAWLSFLRAPSARRAALAGALLAVAAVLYWYYGFFGAVAAAVLLAAGAGGRPRPPLRHLLVAVGIFAVLAGPWAAVCLAHWRAIPGTAELDAFPHPQTALEATPPRLPVLPLRGRDMGEAMAALPWLLGLAGALSAFRRGPGRRVRVGLLLAWLAFWSLAMGPLFPGAPYLLLYRWAAPLRRFWWPTRHIVVANAAWGALAALALDRALARRRRWLPAAGLLVALTAPLSLRLQGAPDRVQLSRVHLPPPGYDRLAELPDGVLVEPPLAPEASGTEQQLVYQLFHGKRLLGGHAPWVDRLRPDEWDRFVAGNSFLAEMRRLDRGEAGEVFDFEAADLAALREAGVRWFALNREYFVFPLTPLRRAWSEVFTALFGPPVIRAKGLRIWDAARWDGRRDRVRLSKPFTWPEGLHPAGPEMPLAGRRPRSPVFDPPPGGLGAPVGGEVGPPAQPRPPG